MSADNWDDCPRCRAEGALREDYEIGISSRSSEFYVIYSGVCYADTAEGRDKGCGFKFKHRHEEKVS